MTTWQNQRWADAPLKNGKYALKKRLGVGVFSATYLGNDQHQNRPVVIKTLASALQSHPNYPQFKLQFKTAAIKLHQCQHPHLVSAIDYFEEYDLPFLVLDYVPGQTGAELLAAGIVLTPEKAVRCIRQLGSALQAMHDRGLCHGDVRPANIIRRHDTDEMVLVDVGIVADFTLGIRQTYANLLMAGYASPDYYREDFRPQPTDDLYALAATLYCLLTGEPPAIARLSSTSIDAADTRVDQRLRPAIFDFGLQPAEWRSPDIKTWLALLPDYEAPSKTPIATPLTDRAVQIAAQIPDQRVSQIPNQIQKQKRSPLRLLVFTGAIAGVLGIGVGLVLRTYRPALSGDSILHTEQSFPPRLNWPISESEL
jgi:eukaryotic-like serine/threonine-protein kinase